MGAESFISGVKGVVALSEPPKVNGVLMGAAVPEHATPADRLLSALKQGCAGAGALHGDAVCACIAHKGA